MKIKEVMQKTGLPENTIRFYETRGLVETTTERRNGRTYHEFSPESVAALEQVIVLRKAQFSIEEIRTMQQHPKAIPQVVSGYQMRIQSDLDTAQRLAQNRDLQEASSWDDLSRRVDRAMHHVEGYESPLRFGQWDPESEEEKRQAMDTYQKRKKFRNNITLYIAVILAILCLALAISLGVIIHRDSTTIPAPVGSTEGWIYYQTDSALLRSTPEGTEELVVYEAQSGKPYSFSYMVDREKIYILDQGTLFSINADGSGLYKLGSVYSGTNSTFTNSLFTLCEGNLYISSYKGGSFGGEWQLYRVPTDGSKSEKLEYNITVSYVCCWEDQLYLFGSSEDDGSMVYVCDGKTGQVLEKEAGNFPYLSSDSATPLYFTDSEGYFSLFDQDTLESQIVKITPENLEGETLERYPGKVRYMNKHYVVYCQLIQVSEVGYEAGDFHLVNRDTGAKKTIPNTAFHGLDFAPTGVTLPQGEFETYP